MLFLQFWKWYAYFKDIDYCGKKEDPDVVKGISNKAEIYEKRGLQHLVTA
jgi:hypothetical protein